MWYRTIRILRLLPVLAGAFMALASGTVAGAGSVAEIPLEAGGPYAVPVASLKDLRFRNTIHQQYDFSCGSAALATLLTYHYNYPVSEKDTFQEMFQRGDQAKIRKAGFSLLDIRNYLAARGFQADGIVADIEQLAAMNVPAIAPIKERGYNHFVVIKGLRDGRILIGDPSAGTRVMPTAKFKEFWVDRVLFVIRNKPELAKFNGETDWRWAPRGPFGDALYRSTLDMSLPKRGPSDF